MCDDVLVPTTTNNGQTDFDVHVIINRGIVDDFRPSKIFESDIRTLNDGFLRLKSFTVGSLIICVNPEMFVSANEAYLDLISHQ